MKTSRHLALALIALGVPLVHSDLATGAVVSSATLSFNLDGNAFANGADVAEINAFAQQFFPTFSYNTNQTFMEFAGHNASALPGRPLPSPATFEDVRAGWVRPDSSNLSYDLNPTVSLQTFSYNPLNVASAGGTGSTRFLGGSSFWYANESLINLGAFSSIWIQFGDLDLSYDPSRAAGGNSGWVFTNNALGSLPLFDIRNASISSVAETEGSPGSLDISGDLYTTPEFAFNFLILPGQDVGSFQFNSLSVPEPSAVALFGIAGAGALLVRRRRHRTDGC